MPALSTFRKTVPALIVLVVLLFFFPVAVGSYQATHGPTSTLNEYLTGVLLQGLIALLTPGGIAFAASFGPTDHSIIELIPRNLACGVPLSLRC